MSEHLAERVQIDLGVKCPCGHLACYHPSAAAQETRLRASGGRYSGECKGGIGAHCRCITSREEVAGVSTSPGAPS